MGYWKNKSIKNLINNEIESHLRSLKEGLLAIKKAKHSQADKSDLR
jgi:hypothetical protein